MIRSMMAMTVAVVLMSSTLVAPALAVSPEPVYGKGGMVASRSAIASEVGAEILAKGGNAIDAAVATGFALAVTHPSAGNLGGGGFMVLRLADGTVITNDHRERAPAAATRDMFLDADGAFVPERSTLTHAASGVPGTVAGLLDVLERYGTLSRREVMAPAITLASRGFEISHDLARDLERYRERFAPHAASVEAFTNKGSPYVAGERLVQKDLAATLSRISKRGRDGFYRGRTADLIVAEMQRGNGLISAADLEAYRSVWRQPIRSRYRGYEIVGMPPPSSGGVLIAQMLNVLEAYDLKRMGFGSSELVHLMIEAERRAFADRAEHLGDPDFFAVPVERLIAKDYARERFQDFEPKRATPSSAVGAGLWPEESPDTTHASFADALGNAVAYTTTLNLSYGSGITVTGAGFLLNNEMDDFS
ncbi:MAG: gamma-glutamyltransferase, partial [Pseudomonadota bacterium]